MEDISPIEKKDIENKIIDWIDVGASNRLIIFRPQKTRSGADLIIKKKGEYGTEEAPKRSGLLGKEIFKKTEHISNKEISLKISSSTTPIAGENFVRDIPLDGLKAEKNFYLVFVYFDEVKQDISSYFWVVPSIFFRDTVEPIKLPDGTSVMRFEAPTELKAQNKFSKFLVNKNKLGKMLLKMIEGKGEFKFEGFGAEEAEVINLDNLKKFIGEARRGTYAGDANPVDNPRLNGSVQLEYQKADYFYQDIYFNGKTNFIGLEIIFQASRPVWIMHYIGNAIDKEASEFLKTALLERSDECRFGQVCGFSKREYKYEDKGQGSLEEFSGQEKISKKGEVVYTLNYRGSLL